MWMDVNGVYLCWDQAQESINLPHEVRRHRLVVQRCTTLSFLQFPSYSWFSCPAFMIFNPRGWLRWCEVWYSLVFIARASACRLCNLMAVHWPFQIVHHWFIAGDVSSRSGCSSSTRCDLSQSINRMTQILSSIEWMPNEGKWGKYG